MQMTFNDRHLLTIKTQAFTTCHFGEKKETNSDNFCIFSCLWNQLDLFYSLTNRGLLKECPTGKVFCFWNERTNERQESSHTCISTKAIKKMGNDSSSIRGNWSIKLLLKQSPQRISKQTDKNLGPSLTDCPVRLYEVREYALWIAQLLVGGINQTM